MRERKGEQSTAQPWLMTLVLGTEAETAGTSGTKAGAHTTVLATQPSKALSSKLAPESPSPFLVPQGSLSEKGFSHIPAAHHNSSQTWALKTTELRYRFTCLPTLAPRSPSPIGKVASLSLLCLWGSGPLGVSGKYYGQSFLSSQKLPPAELHTTSRTIISQVSCLLWSCYSQELI